MKYIKINFKFSESLLIPLKVNPNMQSKRCCRCNDDILKLLAQNYCTSLNIGTTQKCMACNKTVYLVDKLTADNRIFHKACFRCHHCKGTLKLSNYNSFEGVLYCRPHFDQLFKRTGSLEKSFEGTPKIVKPERNIDNEKPAAAKASSMFGGTRDKCSGCQKTVYPTEKVTVNGTPYHKSCFKCCHGGCTISPSNYIAHEGKLYCKHHHIQLIKQKGNLSQLEGDHEKNAGKINGEEVAAET